MPLSFPGLLLGVWLCVALPHPVAALDCPDLKLPKPGDQTRFCAELLDILYGPFDPSPRQSAVPPLAPATRQIINGVPELAKPIAAIPKRPWPWCKEFATRAAWPIETHQACTIWSWVRTSDAT